MKKLLLLAIAFAITSTACKKKNKGDDSPEDPFKLEYSNLTEEQHKQDLEESGIDFVEKINALPEQKFIDVLDYLSQLNLSIQTSSISSVLEIGKAAQKKDIKGIFNASTSATTTTSKLSEIYGIYTWNPATEEFDESTSTSKLEIRFPADEASSTNNAIFTISYVASNVTATLDGESAELPSSISAVLKVNSKEELKLISSYEYKADGTPTKTDVNLLMGVFSFKVKVSNDGSAVSSQLSFLNGTEVLLSLNTSASGNMTVTNANTVDDVDQFIKNANATFEIMNIKLIGQVDIKAISDADKASQNLSDSLRNIKEAQAWNSYAKFIAVNKTSNLIIAKTEFVPVFDNNCYTYWNGSQNVQQCYNDYYLAPSLIFKDNSKVSFEDFFEGSFVTLIDDLDEFAAKFD